MVVLLAGAGSLAIEIAASRLLAPYFGSSTVVWANIIGLILIYLSAGYWLGGRLADRHATPARLGALILGAAVVTAALPFVARPILDVALRGFDAIAVGAVVGSFFAALALFSVPVTLLGMVAPFALRLALRDVAEAGTVSGRLYALSTLGSIAGTFLPAIVTIPLVGTQRTMVGTGVLLAVAAALLLSRRWSAVAVGLAVLLVVPAGTIKESGGLIFEAESQYQYVQVVQHGAVRQLLLNEGVTYQSVWRAGSVLTGGEWDMFLVTPALLGRPAPRVLIIGNAGGTISRAFGRFYPGAHIDGVEIDPVVTDAGRRYLGLGDNPNLRVITDDGRDVLQRSHDRYDLILVDAYRPPYIPFQLASQEFFRLARQHLTPGGMLAINVARLPGDGRLEAAVGGTVATVFPQTWGWAPLKYNELVMGMDRPITLDRLRARAAALPDGIDPLGPLLQSQVRPVAPSTDPLTDDRAPVEWLMDRMIVEQVVNGGRLDEHDLPTAPG